MVRSLAIAVSLLACQAAAHTFIWGVYVNGIDQGTGKGIRTPAYNGAPGKGGYNNGPVKDLTSIDMRCNVMGDIQTSETIKVMPGDNLTFDWHHDYRNDTDDIIADSHHGPSLIYISPDPPTPSSFIKLWHSGKTSLPFPQPGLWSTTSDIRAHYGHMNMRIPAALKPGPYLIRAEMIALHEGDVSYIANLRRGAQFYPDCVQIEVVGDGDVALPSDGVGFPGAYGYGDEGVVHNVYCSTETRPAKTSTTPCVTDYVIPGPTVWSGAWSSTTSVSVGAPTGVTTHVPWSTWIASSVVTSASFEDVKSQTVVGTSVYQASWSSVYAAPTSGVGRW
ncbi:hypothetical protein HBH53_096810 [Parastagonospora nodorum]|nr:hypothetical protein HBH53_096810 [Parastagonospora nodorum]KAH3993160.1 hypothetical protein HBI10_206450 [Parastagonospora nodorum]KAH4011250.1 hypothetical protein HBI13_202200 [Parastagonospora nodorum]KAH4808667.1 hypothetical protein HBH61_120600 [Parastagonospora nodorum]KAH4893887.1 hypothetical protein HBI80_240870 [Parastagonospora nodorum]